MSEHASSSWPINIINNSEIILKCVCIQMGGVGLGLPENLKGILCCMNTTYPLQVKKEDAAVQSV